MNENDLQIGPIWTAGEHRRKGIASYTVQRILDLYKQKNRSFWYIVREENTILRHFIESLGFVPYGEGRKKKRFGVGAMGSFVVEERK